MENILVDIGVKLSSVVTSHNPRYPLHIPFDLVNSITFKKEEWILSFTLEGELHTGFYIYREETNDLKLFEDLLSLLAYFKEALTDLDILHERVEISAQASASVLLRCIQNMKEAFGEELIDDSLEIREALEEELRAHPQYSDYSVRLDYLAKYKEVPQKGPELRVVEEEDNED
jgi:hypothetical protein